MRQDVGHSLVRDLVEEALEPNTAVGEFQKLHQGSKNSCQLFAKPIERLSEEGLPLGPPTVARCCGCLEFVYRKIVRRVYLAQHHHKPC